MESVTNRVVQRDMKESESGDGNAIVTRRWLPTNQLGDRAQ